MFRRSVAVLTWKAMDPSRGCTDRIHWILIGIEGNKSVLKNSIQFQSQSNPIPFQSNPIPFQSNPVPFHFIPEQQDAFSMHCITHSSLPMAHLGCDSLKVMLWFTLLSTQINAISIRLDSIGLDSDQMDFSIFVSFLKTPWTKTRFILTCFFLLRISTHA